MTTLFEPTSQRAAVSAHLAVASGDVLDVRRFAVSERISSLFSVTLTAVSENPDIDLDAVAGLPARFVLAGGAADAAVSRTWAGVCSRLQQLRVDEQGVATYELTVVPALWLATQRRNYRMFQQVSEIDIARTLLDEWGIEHDLRLAGTYKKRKYRVQYGESDYAFLCRMLEDAGVSFTFEHDGAGSRMVLSDAPHTNEPRRERLPFHDDASAARGDFVTRVRVGREVRPGRYTMRDHDYRKDPRYQLVASAITGEGTTEDRLESFHYVPGAFLFESAKGESTPYADDRGRHRSDEAEGAAVARRRLEAKRDGAKAVTFETSALDLGPGVVVGVLGHPHRDLSEQRKLLVVGSSIQGELPGVWTHACDARVADAPYRPPLATPKPKVSGVESATVVGPPGDEIHTDEFGRVRVHFHWDRESAMDDKSSCWIHVSQPWGGSGFGGVNLPRVGQEVIVDFLGGDPDRPIILGRVYTNLQKVPFSLPANKTQTGLKSSSTGGGGGYNEIMMEDAGGKELFRLQAERDLDKLVKNDETVTIGNDRAKSIGNDDNLNVGNNRTVNVGSNETLTIGTNRAVTIGSNETITIGANQEETILGNRSFTLAGTLTETINGASTLTQTGNQTDSITGNRDLTLVGNLSETINGDKSLIQLGSRSDMLIGASNLLQVGNETVMRAGNELHLQLGSETQIRIGASSHLHVGAQTETVTAAKTLTAAAVTIDSGSVALVKAALMELLASGSLSLDAPVVTVTGSAVVNVSAGGMLTVAGGVTNVKGGTVNVEASGNATVKGSIVKLNC